LHEVGDNNIRDCGNGVLFNGMANKPPLHLLQYTYYINITTIYVVINISYYVVFPKILDSVLMVIPGNGSIIFQDPIRKLSMLSPDKYNFI